MRPKDNIMRPKSMPAPMPKKPAKKPALVVSVTKQSELRSENWMSPSTNSYPAATLATKIRQNKNATRHHQAIIKP